VSFLHGSNDGQKGMGLIMLILIGTVPTAYALNRAMPESEMRTWKVAIRSVKLGPNRLQLCRSEIWWPLTCPDAKLFSH
jgi:phosphate/sulfate permease